MINDHLSDMFARIKNAGAVGKKTIRVPYTKLCEAVARVMLEEKYLAGVAVEGDNVATHVLVITLSYHQGTPAISSLRRISKPGVRIQRRVNHLKPVLSGLGISILSTSSGIMSDRTARTRKLGGEVLAELY